ncbi:MAG TPA: LytTR family DNA-binding domain-containing protein [Rhizomicrobium sp.]|nr:LytTR family DNA-binding domain-containing protein [Rhizomicrobium sp.]
MRTIRTIVVDDVALARERVRHHLAGERDIEIVGEASNGVDAVRLIARLAPDLVFLDVQLPDLDGFEIAARLPVKPVIVYLTAHDDKAIQAFEAGALDYLTKPFDRERFERALNRARAQIGLKSAVPRPEPLRRLAIKDKERTELVATADIDYIDVAGHYLCVHVGKQVHLIRGTLSDLEEKLDPGAFARIHRSAIVRLDRVTSLVARRNGDSDVVLAGGAKLVMSRNYGEAVKKRLGLGED